MRQHEETLTSGITDNTPTRLKNLRDARAYFGIITDSLEIRSPAAEALADLAIAIEHCINDEKIRDWVGNRDVENQMKARLDDLLYHASHS